MNIAGSLGVASIGDLELCAHCLPNPLEIVDRTERAGLALERLGAGLESTGQFVARHAQFVRVKFF